MIAIKYCSKCNLEKYYDEINQKYVCHPCKAEYARSWRLKNPDKVRTANTQQRKKRIEYIKKEKLIDPDRYKKKVVAKKFCDKHQLLHELNADGSWVCRECKRLYAINYRINNKHKMYRRLKIFSLTLDQYNELWNKTDGRCYICDQPETRIVKGILIDISIDHCHESEKLGKMKVRGLLCGRCNKSLGGFKDDITLLQKAIEYLKRHEHTG